MPEGPDDLDALYEPEVIAALDAWSAVEDDGADASLVLPSRLSRWGRSAALGMVLSGVALGLQEVLDPKDQRQIVVEVDACGEPEHLPISLFLDPDSPAGSLCVIRRDAPPRPIV